MISLQELKTNTQLWFNPKFPYQKLDTKEDVEISIGIKNRVLYITFLGSVSFKDWLNNFKFWVKPYKRMKHTFFVHAGFIKIYKICRPVVHEWISKTSEYDEIIINGHSLGGAITTLCLEDIEFLRESGIHNKPCWAFASGPRVFAFINNKIIKKRCMNLFRINYKNDLVSKLPPFLFGYKHVGNLYQIGKKSWNFLIPSSAYNHDVNVYKNLDEKYKSTEHTNHLYNSAVKAYKIIYVVFALLAITIGITIIL